ncbi:vesicle transport protein USE1 isoform X2 [Ooceraea biroi]|uniref:Osteoclast-stimulating factor 1 n=1 Tax=Ooceraea biroi TaxID=2015173 RepID=A0A026WSG2_OOCBI|nr:vesicle transport protein USE1 isoform X2 [Ooceraea biroi]EZA58913.1 Osteoclast-stimulating factor [Ooceraea biroi]
MIQMSRLEINIRRLLTRCELIAKDDPHKDWKLEKYISALDDMMNKLQNIPNKPSKDTMIGYTKRIDFLKGVINAMKLSNPVERVVAAQLISKNTASVNNPNTNITTQIHQKTIAKYNKELRADLFHTDKSANKDGVRQRLSNSNIQDEDLDAILKYNRNIQEKIAENMLSMTSSMKEHALAASAIIKKDIGVLETSDKLTDINAVKLKKEALKLEEHTNSKWRCWVWLMIAFVLVVFFSKVKVVRALCKYTAQRTDELSFDEGDLLYVYDRDADPNWWRAKCRDQKGLIPVTYVEEQTQEVELPLHDAARRGNLSFLKEYLKQGISGTGLDAAGNTPLYWAARTGHLECARELLSLSNTMVNAQNKMGDTALHVAAGHSHLEMVNLLLEHNADATLRNNDGLSAEELASDASIKNAIQLQQRHYDSTSGYDDEDYNDDSD